MTSETSELNRETGTLNGNMNVNKMSDLAPASTHTGAQAGQCAICECALADAAPCCWKCCLDLTPAAAGRHAGAICIAMATCKCKLHSAGAPPRAGSMAGASGRAAAAQLLEGAWAWGQEVGCTQWQCTMVCTAHQHQRLCAWLQSTKNRTGTQP